MAYAYNAQGIRTAKRVNNLRTAYLLDGGNVVAEVQNNTVTDSYLRGINLIRREAASETEYYLFNAHGDVVTTTNINGTVNQSYDYDAFGVEKDPDALDSNPFRYCGEYLDFETGSYYLRARYYEPTLGRFTQQDTHWNTANMIYGDNPLKINEREDALGLKSYSYAPQIKAIIQCGNLYGYCIQNPIQYVDSSGSRAQAVQETPGTVPAAVPSWIFNLATLLSLLRATVTWTQPSQIDTAVSAQTTPPITVPQPTSTSSNITLQDLEDYLIAYLSACVDMQRTYKNDPNVHHIVARTASAAAPAKEILEDKLGININDPVNLVALSARVHVHLHTDTYYKMINALISSAYNSGTTTESKTTNVINMLKAIKGVLININEMFQ